MKRIPQSARRDASISSLPIRLNATLSGSATQVRTNRNSKGACIHETATKRFNAVTPPTSITSVMVAPRLKKPIRPPVNNEKPVSRTFLVASRMGGVHLTFAIMNAYRKESATGAQLLAKTSSVSATPPKMLAPRTGPMTRAPSKKVIPVRNVGDDAISIAPASEPMMKASTVAPNARSMTLIATTTTGEGFVFGGGCD